MFKGLFALAAVEARNAVKRQTVSAAYFAVAGALGLFAIGYLLNALQMWMALKFGPIEANVYIGLALAAIAAIVVAVGMSKRAKPANAPSPLTAGAALAAPVLAQRLIRRANLSTTAIIAVVIGGALLGRKIARD